MSGATSAEVLNFVIPSDEPGAEIGPSEPKGPGCAYAGDFLAAIVGAARVEEPGRKDAIG
jgi:hypothetical protein